MRRVMMMMLHSANNMARKVRDICLLISSEYEAVSAICRFYWAPAKPVQNEKQTTSLQDAIQFEKLNPLAQTKLIQPV